MVKKYTFKKCVCGILAAGMMMLSGCTGGSGNGGNTQQSYTWKDYTTETTEYGAEESNSKKSLMNGPDTPPSGMRYDEWKGFAYSDETTFQTTSSWNVQVYDKTLPSKYGYSMDPPNIDGKLEVQSVKVETVGGEMQLRSGGYVDLTIEFSWSGQLRLVHDDSYPDSLSYLIWQDVEIIPCDAYTGTALINYSDNEDAQDHELSVGQAEDSGLVESDVTFNNRTYRLFAGFEQQNSSFGGYNYDYRNGKTITTLPVSSVLIVRARIPADYDGLVLAVMKDISWHLDKEIDAYGNSVLGTDYFADILTDDEGGKHDQSEFYFMRVSDLIDKFADKTE